MSVSQVFVDTNILVYAHDVDVGDKHVRAKALMKELWERDLHPTISVQVLQELYTTLIRKGINKSKAKQVVSHYLSWDVVMNSRDVFLKGIDICERWKISTWDAWIVAAAAIAGARCLWSEDLVDGQDYHGVRVENPLKRE